ncbi:HAMP domain-containing sensor histidine kinase [Kribbella solani]|uniref:histidine kinase n=1 Tax=Kribbella solani TaxID=236067 RepID=A0A841DQB4_9ACTN|nr:ATP-binding protein [Kribbella solani]MBB5977618.1 signal transduction histidine kinase [Kribbella solani]
MTSTATSPDTLPRLRTRLAFVHSGLVFGIGVVLLTVVAVALYGGSNTIAGPGQTAAANNTSNLSTVLRVSALACLVLAGLSVTVGWMSAGRALRPLHAMTLSARRLSADDLATRLPTPPAYRELTELADTLDGLLLRLHESFTAQRQFVANASHELRTPLTVQRTLLQLALADPDATATTLRSACNDLLALGRQQEELIAALLALANGQRGVEHWTRFDLADLAAQLAVEHQAAAEQRGVRIHSALAPSTVMGDIPLATSLITNLIENAIRHNHRDGSVELTTSATGRLTISNTGPFVPPTEVARLTEPFQRLDATRTGHTDEHADGHGLGLAIVAAIARAHNAALTVQALPSGGLEISVDFVTPGAWLPGAAE